MVIDRDSDLGDVAVAVRLAEGQGPGGDEIIVRCQLDPLAGDIAEGPYLPRGGWIAVGGVERSVRGRIGKGVAVG